MSHLYLDERLDLAAASAGELVRLTGDEARHAVTVSRVRVGEQLSVGNGRGSLAAATVVETAPRELVLELGDVVTTPAPSPRITLVQALAKGDRDELAVQAATELGVDAIVPWSASRSVSRWDGPKAEKGRARWASIVREATKQSIRPWMPEVAPLTATAGLARLLDGVRVLLLEPTATTPLTGIRSDGDGDARDLALVVGPEGGIAPAEIERLVAAGAETVRLGDSVLRTSTAGPAAIAVLNARLGRW